MLELWHAWACPYCMRVRGALAEKGIPYRSREIELASRAPELQGRNPKGAVPVLVDGADVVVGSLPILEHLCSRWPYPPLFPARPGREAVVRAYARVDALFAPHLPKIARGSPDDRVQALAATRQVMAEIDAEVPEEGFLLGELSVADLALASFMARLPPDWRPIPLGFARLARWERAVMRRPTVRDQMGPSLMMVG
jgi:glutathione S-transferase